MNRHLERRIELVARKGFEQSYLSAQMQLAGIAEIQSPEDDSWMTRLESARIDLFDAIGKTEDATQYYKAYIMYIAAPLFTLPLLKGTVDDKILNSNFKAIRKEFVQITRQIGEDTTASREMYRQALTQEEADMFLKSHGELLGIGSEAAIMASLLTMPIYERGYIPLPAFTWEDDGKYNLLHHRYADSADESTLIDIKLVPLDNNTLPIKIQVKTRARDAKKYAGDITVINCLDVVNAISPGKGILTLPELFSSISDNTERAKMMQTVGALLARQLGIHPTTSDELVG
jgi:hypothetical protein